MADRIDRRGLACTRHPSCPDGGGSPGSRPRDLEADAVVIDLALVEVVVGAAGPK